MTPKAQRSWLAVLGVAAVGGAATLALAGLQDRAAFFYAPGDVRRLGLPLGRAVRLGGMVEAGSLVRQPDGVSVRFVVGDGQARVPVRFRGVPPDLFREGSGVVAEGRFERDGSFTAGNLLAKHDERYMPPELAGNLHETKTLRE